MSKIQWKPSTLLAPVPAVMVSCGSMEKPNALTIAWTGIINSEPAMTYISVRPSRYSYNLIKQSGEFVINLPTKGLVRATDLCGVKTGAKDDKFKLARITAEKSNIVSAPSIAECPISLECKVTEIKELGSHHMFLAEIACVNVDEKFIDENGKLNLAKSGLIAYSHGEYFALGARLGKFGGSVKKKTSPAKRK